MTLKQINSGYRFSVPTGKETHEDHHLFSPLVCASKTSGVLVIDPSDEVMIMIFIIDWTLYYFLLIPQHFLYIMLQK